MLNDIECKLQALTLRSGRQVKRREQPTETEAQHRRGATVLTDLRSFSPRDRRPSNPSPGSFSKDVLRTGQHKWNRTGD